MDYFDKLKPFKWVEYGATASVILYADLGYKADLFKTRSKDGFVGSGDDWEALAKTFIKNQIPELKNALEYDSEFGMFCVYSSNIPALKKFALNFKNACEDDVLIAKLFSQAVPPPYIS